MEENDAMMATPSPSNSVENQNAFVCQHTNDFLSWPSISVLIFAILGLAGNGCLLFVILRRRYLHNITNILVVNLTVNDILLFVSTVPFIVEADLHPCWQFGTVICKLGNAIWVVFHSVCMFTLTALAVERYCVVTSRTGFRSKSCALGTIWVLAILLALPVLVTAHMPYEGACFWFARDINFAKAYTTCHVIITFVIPLATIAFFYIRMARTLLHGKSMSSDVGIARSKGVRKRRRLAAIVLVLVLIFAFFWTPFHTVNLLAVYGALWHIPWGIAQVLIFAHNISIYIYLFLNPLVVFFMSSSLRRELISCRRATSREKQEIDSQSDISDVDLELQQPINDEPSDPPDAS